MSLGLKGLDAPEEQTAESLIAKARAWVGPEDSLNEVHTLQFSGNLILFEQGFPESGTISLTFRKPDSQLMVVSLPNREIISGFNGSEGFHKHVTRNRDGFDTQIRIMDLDEARLFRAMTRENLGFFRPFPDGVARVELVGHEETDEVEVSIVQTVHPEGFVFVRRFESETGRLASTVTPSGVLIEEASEIIANGLRFPQRLSATSGGMPLYEVDFTFISVNPETSENLFDYPWD